MKRIVPDYIESLVPYPPGKPIEELQREYGLKGSIKLASNENPLGPSPKAVAAVSAALNNLHRYPDGSAYYLKEKLATKLGVGSDWIVLGNGSDEILQLAVRAFMLPGDQAIMSKTTFLLYRIIVQAVGAQSIVVPLVDLRHDLKTIGTHVTPKTRLVFLNNPNNPTGTMVTRKELEAFANNLPDDVILVLDEAYREFVRSREFPDSIEFARKGRKVLVLRTLSKAYGLAGLRIGYGIADPLLVSYLDRIRQPFNVNMLAQIAALAALDDSDHVEKTLENNRSGLGYLQQELAKMGVKHFPTEANFFLVDTDKDADRVYQDLLREGVIVRSMKEYGLPTMIRVTVGVPQENERFLGSLRKVLQGPPKTGRKG
jgi:histidinol-phosphate aminotransferase